MNKSDLSYAIAQKSGFTVRESDIFVKSFIDVVSETLASGESISLVGFGIFEVSERAEKRARNPKTGEKLVVPAHRIPKFRPGRTLKGMVMESKQE